MYLLDPTQCQFLNVWMWSDYIADSQVIDIFKQAYEHSIMVETPIYWRSWLESFWRFIFTACHRY